MPLRNAVQKMKTIYSDFIGHARLGASGCWADQRGVAVVVPFRAPGDGRLGTAVERQYVLRRKKIIQTKLQSVTNNKTILKLE